MESEQSFTKSSRTGGTKKFFTILVIGVACLLAGLAGRHFLYLAADESNIDTSPPQLQERNAPFITTPDPVVETMVELAALSEDDVVYDLGCGDGRIVITAVLKSGCTGVGFDIDPQRAAEAKENARVHEVEDQVEIVEQDVFTADLSKADVAMMYLLSWMMNKLLPQFEQMKPGCRIVSHNYWIDGVEPDQFIETQAGQYQTPHGVYLYTTPLKKNAAMQKGKPPRPGNLPSRLANRK